MQKPYYIFCVLISLFSLVLGIFLTSILYCSCEESEALSLKDFSKNEKKKLPNDKDCEIFVDVSGAVINPGVVCLDEGAIVDDAIKKAEGFNISAYAFKYVAQRLNLAKILENQEKIYIPFRDDVVCTRLENDQVNYIDDVMKEIRTSKSVLGNFGESDSQKHAEEVKTQEKTDSCISLNEASKEEIMQLSGIGEARARDIMEGRPYSKLDDIKNVSGIGEVTYENIKDFICL